MDPTVVDEIGGGIELSPHGRALGARRDRGAPSDDRARQPGAVHGQLTVGAHPDSTAAHRHQHGDEQHGDRGEHPPTPGRAVRAESDLVAENGSENRGRHPPPEGQPQPLVVSIGLGVTSHVAQRSLRVCPIEFRHPHYCASAVSTGICHCRRGPIPVTPVSTCTRQPMPTCDPGTDNSSERESRLRSQWERSG